MNENIGVLPKLNNPLVSWQQKIELALHAWSSDECRIPNKQQALLGWICQQLIDFYKKKKSCSSIEIKGLWEYLYNILYSLNSPDEKQKDSLTLMPQLLQVFIDVFSSGLNQNYITLIQLQCAQMILSNSIFHSSFLAKFDNYVIFISSLLTLFVYLLDTTEQHKNMREEIFGLVEISLNLCQNMQRKQTNHKKVFERACQHLLIPLVSVYHLLANSSCLQSLDDVSQERINLVKAHLLNTLSNAIFRKEHLQEYYISVKTLDSAECIEHDTSEPKAKKARIGNYTKELFVTLRKHCLQHEENFRYEAITNFIPQLFVEFLNSQRHNKLGPSPLEFQFFTEMCSLLGVHFKDQTCATATPHTFGLVYSLLDTLLSFNVYQVADDNANDGVQLKWFNSFTELLLQSPPSPKVFQCLQVLLELNHYIIEPHLNTLLQHCWNGCNVIQISDSISAQDIFLSSLVKIYAKLRQFNNFISQLLKSLKALNNVSQPWHGFPLCFKEELIKACQSLPYGLATSLWKAFNKEFCTYISTLCFPNEKKGKSKTTSKENIYKFERAVGLFRLFILNTSLGGIVEQHKTDGIMKTLSDLIFTSNTEILGSLFDALPKFADHKLYVSACTSVLLLYHALQEMNIFLNKFKLVSTEVSIEVSTSRWQQHVRDCIKQNPMTTDNERLSYVKVLVAVQRLRMYLRSMDSCHENDRNELINYVYHWLDDTRSCDSVSVWNQQLWNVDQSTFTIAYWFTICNYAPVLLTVCSKQHKQQFVQYLIKTLTTEKRCQDEIKCSDLTLQSISKTLLNSSVFHQQASMQKCFVGTLWHEIGLLQSVPSDGSLHGELLQVIASVATLRDNECNEDQEAAGQSFEEDDSENEHSSEDEEDEPVQNQSQKLDLTKIPSTITPLVGTGKVLNKTLHQLISGEKLDVLKPELANVVSLHISLLSFCPLDWLTDQSLVGSVLGLLACDALANSMQLQKSSEVFLRTPYLVRRLLIVLLNGCVSRKRYLIHHVISMDHFHLYLFSSCLHMMDSIKSNAELNQLQNVSFELLSVVMRYSLKTSSPIDSFIKELIKRIGSLTENLTSESKKSTLRSLRNKQTLLRTCGIVLDVLEQVITCKTSRLNELKMAANLFSQITEPILALLQVITMKNDKKPNQTEAEAQNKNLTVLLTDCPLLLGVYSGVIHVYSISQTSRKFKHFKTDFQKLSWQPILAPFLKYAVDLITLTKEIPGANGCENFKQLSSSYVTPMMLSLHLLDVIMSSLETLDLDLPIGFHNRLLASILNLLNCLDLSNDGHVKVKSKAMDVVLSVLQGCSSGMLDNLLNGLCSELNLVETHSSSRLLTCLQVWLMMLTGKFSKLRKKELRAFLPQVLVALQSIVQQSNTLDLSILSLEVMTKVLSLGTSMIHSHHCNLIFHGSLLLPLDHSDAERFPVMFQTQFSLLSTALFYQSEAVYKAIHVFITCVKSMLCGLCNYCNDRASNKSEKPNQEHQLNCAEKMARLYQEIATHKAALSKYVPYMIAEYFHQIQQVSLQEKIKKMLVPGIYCLLDACGEHEMALLHAVLDKGSRQLFSSFTEEYNKFYKFKGKA